MVKENNYYGLLPQDEIFEGYCEYVKNEWKPRISMTNKALRAKWKKQKEAAKRRTAARRNRRKRAFFKKHSGDFVMVSGDAIDRELWLGG